MPRYFFDIFDGEIQRDASGVELEDVAEARGQAVIILAGTLMPKNALTSLHGADWRVEVRDETQAVLFTLEYRAGEYRTGEYRTGAAP